jgi:acetyl/propionyl-CoA carboxylase alpha subunit
MRILIANRGEIARRVIRTAHRLGHETVAVFAEPDRDAPFVSDATLAVCIGPAELAKSYLSIERILDAADRTGATAVHPGYGFLSENTEFARAVVDAGLVWIGPHAEAVERMGSKIEARRIAADTGVPIIPGFDESQDPADLAAAAERIGFPVLVKAAAGGGGKGIRIVHDAAGFSEALDEAMTEAERSFGDRAMIVERYIQRPRHVEVQVVGDRHGNVIDLGTRECSVQRRYQKLLEEAPAPNLPDATRSGLRASATELARAMRYDSAGTVEFIVDDETGDYFFLEMNTRLQVEHPVTELVTGLDLVELMIRSAMGEPLQLGQADVTSSGHAIEARINAEDPAAGFFPQTGTITQLVVPAEARWDSGVVEGSVVSPHYDAMLAKLIVSGPDRPTALARLRRALDGLVIGGVVTSCGFHRWLLDQEPVVAGRVTTRFLDETFPPETGLPGDLDAEAAAAVAAERWHDHTRSGSDPGAWSSLPRFSTTPHRMRRAIHLEHHSGAVIDVDVDVNVDRDASGEVNRNPAVSRVGDRSVAVNVGGYTHTFRVLGRTEHWAPSADEGHGHAGAIVSPFPSVVTEIRVAVGDHVHGGTVVVVVEAMKMLHSLRAAGPGRVAALRVAVGDQTQTNQVLVTFEEDLT